MHDFTAFHRFEGGEGGEKAGGGVRKGLGKEEINCENSQALTMTADMKKKNKRLAKIRMLLN